MVRHSCSLSVLFLLLFGVSGLAEALLLTGLDDGDTRHPAAGEPLPTVPAAANTDEGDHRFHLIRESQQDAELELEQHPEIGHRQEVHEQQAAGEQHQAQVQQQYHASTEGPASKLSWGAAEDALAAALKGLEHLSEMGPLLTQVEQAARRSASELADAIAAVAAQQQAGAKLLTDLRNQPAAVDTAALQERVVADSEQLARARAGLVAAQAAQRTSQAAAMHNVARTALRGAQLLAEQALGAAERAARATAAAAELSRQATALEQVVSAAAAAARLQTSAAAGTNCDTAGGGQGDEAGVCPQQVMQAQVTALRGTREGLVTGEVRLTDAWGSITAAAGQLSQLGVRL